MIATLPRYPTIPVKNKILFLTGDSIVTYSTLVTNRREGRTKLHFLNPIPIQQLAQRWISKYAQPFAHAMVGLQTDLEQNIA